jgi:hypothetical protein
LYPVVLAPAGQAAAGAGGPVIDIPPRKERPVTTIAAHAAHTSSKRLRPMIRRAHLRAPPWR